MSHEIAEEEDESSNVDKIPEWKKDEEAFLRHFKISYSDFGDLKEKYEKTRRANEEAAILWAIHEGKSHGLLENG